METIFFVVAAAAIVAGVIIAFISVWVRGRAVDEQHRQDTLALNRALDEQQREISRLVKAQHSLIGREAPRLPPVDLKGQQPEQQRRLSVVGLVPKHQRRCTECAHWDHEEGQAVMASNPVWAQGVMPAIPPRMFGTKQLDEDGNPIMGTEDISAKTRWEDAGACTAHSTVLWPEEATKCDQYSQVPAAQMERATCE